MGLFLNRALTGFFLSVLCGMMLGCTGDIKTYCEDVVSCEELSSADQDACVADLKGSRKAADAYGCRDEFDDYYACMAEYGECADGVYSDGRDENEYPNCASEGEALDGCGSIESNV